MTAIQPPPAHDPSRLLWVDVLRVAGAFLVVLAHIETWGAGPALGNAFFYIVSRIAVPIFFMVSGYLLLSKQEDWWVFLKKRASKILIPFFFWSIIYDIYRNNAFIDSGVTLTAVYDLFLRILDGPRASHLWYLYSLIGLYFFTPILRLFVDRARNRDLLYFIGLWFFVIPILSIVNAFTRIRFDFDLQFAAGYVGYFLLGLYLGRLRTTPRRVWWTLGLLAASLGFSFAVFYFQIPPQDNEAVFRSYPSLNIILMSCAAFILLKAAGEKFPARFTGILKVFSDAGFGIYLVHMLVLYWLGSGWKALGFETRAGPSYIVIPLVAVTAFLVSFAITYVLRKIPILKAVVP
jgi:surface polysaccharide O-acyltransferase-like enzyme